MNEWRTPNALASHLDLAGGYLVLSVGFDQEKGEYFAKMGKHRKSLFGCQNGKEAQKEAMAWVVDIAPQMHAAFTRDVQSLVEQEAAHG
jgi:hypothetical protein